MQHAKSKYVFGNLQLNPLSPVVTDTGNFFVAHFAKEEKSCEAKIILSDKV